MKPTRFALVSLLALVGVLLNLCGCAPREPAVKTTPSHDIRGEIVGVVTERRTLLVHHEEIPGYMPEMTMEFLIRDADITFFREGQRIAARMVEEESGEFSLEGIRVLDAAKDAQVDVAAKTLQEDTFIRGKRVFRDMGEPVPSFTLYNQAGEVVRFDQFRGKRVVLNFIFTRCPVATMCPAATARMISLQRLAKEQGVRDFELISITLDPSHDTPPVLKAYGESRGADFSNFTFLTGPESAIRSLLAQFGILAKPSEDIWKHTLSTILIDADGKIAYRADGSAWDIKEFIQRL